MLKRMFIKKMVLISAILFTIGLLYLMPKENTLKVKKTTEYTDSSILTHSIYLLNKDNYLGMCKVVISDNSIDVKAFELLEALIIGNSRIPNGFRGIIPPNTKINSIKYENNLIKVDFSKDILEVNKNDEEKMIEAIVYTLTSIKEIKKVIIYVEGEILTELPNSHVHLPSTLDRKYGINKEYDLENYKNISNVTVYYLHKDHYYVPVTKYYNGDENKIKIIINELASSYIQDSNLMSYLNSNTKLLKTYEELDTLFLVFNEYIFSDMYTKNILEEVAYSISLSLSDTLDTQNVSFVVNDKEIYKTTMEILENY